MCTNYMCICTVCVCLPICNHVYVLLFSKEDTSMFDPFQEAEKAGVSEYLCTSVIVLEFK